MEPGEAVLEEVLDLAGVDDELVGRAVGEDRPRPPGDVPLAREEGDRLVRGGAEQIGGVGPEGWEHDRRVGERLEAGEQQEVTVEVVGCTEMEAQAGAGPDPRRDLIGPPVYPSLGDRRRDRRLPEPRGRELADGGGEPTREDVVGVAVVDGVARRGPDLADPGGGLDARCRPPGPAAFGGVGGEIGDDLTLGGQLRGLDDEGRDGGDGHVDRRSVGAQPVDEPERTDHGHPMPPARGPVVEEHRYRPDRREVDGGVASRRGEQLGGQRAQVEAIVDDAHGERRRFQFARCPFCDGSGHAPCLVGRCAGNGHPGGPARRKRRAVHRWREPTVEGRSTRVPA